MKATVPPRRSRITIAHRRRHGESEKVAVRVLPSHDTSPIGAYSAHDSDIAIVRCLPVGVPGPARRARQSRTGHNRPGARRWRHAHGPAALWHWHVGTRLTRQPPRRGAGERGGPGGAYVNIPWRRRDQRPEQVNAVVVAEATGRRVRNVARMAISREAGELVFQADQPGTYYVYYLPYTGTFRSNYPRITYRAVEATADTAWLRRTGWVRARARGGARCRRPRSPGSRPTTPSTASRRWSTPPPRRSWRRSGPGSRTRRTWRSRRIAPAPSACSPTCRRRGRRRGAFQPFHGTARRGEYYTFQVGVWAHRGAVDSCATPATAWRSAAALGGSARGR
jgi:hypothetical protein